MRKTVLAGLAVTLAKVSMPVESISPLVGAEVIGVAGGAFVDRWVADAFLSEG
jgi:hypothetical protein